MPNGDYCRLFHLNTLQERKRWKRFYFISLISKTYVQVAWDEVQNINNEVPTQTVHKMLKLYKIKQTNQTKHSSLFSPDPLMNMFGTIFQARMNFLTILTHLFRDLSLQFGPCMVSATSPHPLEKRQTGRQGKEMNCLNLILAFSLICHIFFISGFLLQILSFLLRFRSELSAAAGF